MIKQQFGFNKVRYRGLAKNTAQVVTLPALSNLWMARRRLIGIAGMSASEEPESGLQGVFDDCVAQQKDRVSAQSKWSKASASLYLFSRLHCACSAEHS